MLILIFTLLVLINSTITEDQSLRCGKNQDCKRLDSFCNGTYTCNLTARCAKQDASYDPCTALRKMATLFNREQAEYTVGILCIEEIKSCIEVYYCTRDEDCDDTLFCNGKERCIDGHCKPSHTLCNDCNEKTRCAQTSQSVFNDATLSVMAEDEEEEANPTLLYIIAIIFAIVGTISVFILLAYIFHWANTD